FAELAERCGWATWEHPDQGPDLCCGLAGRAYGLIALHQVTGDAAWLARARELAGRAATELEERPVGDGLYRGTRGVAVLAAEIDRPEIAAMPVFASEGWPRVAPRVALTDTPMDTPRVARPGGAVDFAGEPGSTRAKWQRSNPRSASPGGIG